MMESQTLKFGEKIEGISQGCDIIEAKKTRPTKALGLLILTDNRANMDNHNPTEREKERAKILAEELKIFQGVTNKMAQNSWSVKINSRARCGGFIPQNRDDSSSLWVMRFRDVVSMLYLLDAYYLTLERLLEVLSKDDG